MSARHLSFLETGRSRPSREMVLLLAEELDVPLRGRNELMMAAGYAPAYTEHALDDAEMNEVQRSLNRILDGPRAVPGRARRRVVEHGGRQPGRRSCSPTSSTRSCSLRR